MSYFSYGGPSQPMDSFVHEIFCVPLFEFSCVVDEQQDIIKELEKPEYQVYEDRNDALHEHPLFQNFSAKVVTAVKNVWDKYGYIDIEPYVTAMWGNSIGEGGLHAHAHSNSFSLVSGILAMYLYKMIVVDVSSLWIHCHPSITSCLD